MDKGSVIGAMACVSFLGGPGGVVVNVTFASLANWLTSLIFVLIPIGQLAFRGHPSTPVRSIDQPTVRKRNHRE
jgi:uncharacterized membrane protein